MSTESTASLTKAFVAAILAYSPIPTTGGSTIGELTSNRVYVGRPPVGVLYPHVVVRLQSFRVDSQYDNHRATGVLECQVYARPRTKAEEADEIADRLVQFFTNYRVAGLSLVFGTGAVRQALAPFTTPADAEVVAIRVAGEFSCWPTLLIGGLTAS